MDGPSILDRPLAFAAVLLVMTAPAVHAGTLASTPAGLGGVYRSVPDGRVLAGGLKNQGGLSTLVGRRAPSAVSAGAPMDPGRLCLPVGPFRMMARTGSKIEIVVTPRDVVILFEDVAHGLFRTVALDRGHGPSSEPGFQGDSIGRFERGALLIDTIGFNDSTWLNAKGVTHSDSLRLRESVRPVLGGRFLEYRVTAADPEALPHPFTYVRYYERVAEVIGEDVCLIDDEPAKADPESKGAHGGQ